MTRWQDEPPATTRRRLSNTALAALAWLAYRPGRMLTESSTHAETGPDHLNVHFVAGYEYGRAHRVPLPVFRVLVRDGLIEPVDEPQQITCSHAGTDIIEHRRTDYRITAAGTEALTEA